MIESNGVGTERFAGERLSEIEAAHADVDRSAIGELRTEEAVIERSAVRSVQASDVTVGQSAVGKISVERGTVKQSAVGIVAGRGVACDEVRTVILAAPVVRGQVHTWLDLRTAVAIGLGMALGKALLGIIAHLARRLAR